MKNKLLLLTILLISGLATFAQPVVASAGADQTICSGASTTLNGSATGAYTPFTYSWSPATGLSSTTVAAPTAAPTSTTSYVLTVTDNASNTSKDTVVVFVNAN